MRSNCRVQIIFKMILEQKKGSPISTKNPPPKRFKISIVSIQRKFCEIGILNHPIRLWRRVLPAMNRELRLLSFAEHGPCMRELLLRMAHMHGSEPKGGVG